MMYDWLKRKFENRSIAEMSIWFTISAVGSFIAIFALFGLFISIAGGGKEEGVRDLEVLLFLTGLFLWLVFLLWLWIGMVRTAWKWGHERLGTPIFKYLQIAFFVVIVLEIALHRDLQEYREILPFVLLGFDIIIVIMILNFLSIAWFARCKIPFRAYREICSIIVLVIIQILLFT